jgi:ATP-dependent DNA helicase RecQ
LLQRAGALRGDGTVAPFDAGALDFKQLAALKQHSYTKLAQVIAYAQLRSCRHAYITDYFGEPGAERSCHSCDNCERIPAAPETGAAVDGASIRAALAGAARFAGRIGMVNLASILVGKENRFIRDQPWVVNVPAYGSMSGWSQARVRLLLEELVAVGCLSQTSGQYPMVELSDRGRTCLGGTETVTLTIPADPEPATPPAADPALFERLRVWRSEVARRQGVPAYVVFHDRTLNELAARRPVDLVELETLPGIGRSKLERYGQALLDIIAASIR